mmetsp:Transcript_47150/g.52537  ORF Transcript_47150/g.52537 Transcript_47150/m.52537 type:complete len:433 (-) Transcript_47150:384-1682(-)
MDTMDELYSNHEESLEDSAYSENDDDASYDSFLDQWSSNEGYVRDGILGIVFCGAVLATCFYLSHQYTVGERKAEAELEQRRMEEINRKVEEVESKKNEIAKVIHGFAISMISITRNNGNDNDTDTDTENDTDNNKSRSTISTILHGNHDHDQGTLHEDFTEKTRFVGMNLGDDDEDEMIDIEAAAAEQEPVMRFLELDLVDDDDDDDEDQLIDIEAIEQPAAIAETITNTTNTNNTMMNSNSNSNLYLKNEGKGSDGINNDNDDEHEECDAPVPIPALLLLKAADNNPCAICLEAFVPSDNIIFCSNHLTKKTTIGGTTIEHTGLLYPHCFHEECSLDYMFAHTEGVQAPCPLCRKPFLCSYADRNGGANTNNNNNSMPHQQQQNEQDEDQIAMGGSAGSMNFPSHPSSVSFTDLMEAASSEEAETESSDM